MGNFTNESYKKGIEKVNLVFRGLIGIFTFVFILTLLKNVNVEFISLELMSCWFLGITIYQTFKTDADDREFNLFLLSVYLGLVMVTFLGDKQNEDILRILEFLLVFYMIVTNLYYNLVEYFTLFNYKKVLSNGRKISTVLFSYLLLNILLVILNKNIWHYEFLIYGLTFINLLVLVGVYASILFNLYKRVNGLKSFENEVINIVLFINVYGMVIFFGDVTNLNILFNTTLGLLFSLVFITLNINED